MEGKHQPSENPIAYTDNISRLSRLTAIILRLQSRSRVTLADLSEQFGVSERTLYRDLHALEQAGLPIVMEEGKGYSLVQGYTLPPISLSEEEANALIFGEKMIEKTKDRSLIEAFFNATAKVRAALGQSDKERADFLAKRTIIGKNWEEEISSSFLSEIQKALTHFQVLRIHYRKAGAEQSSERDIEPFAIYHNMDEDWVLIAWCRLREDFRSFRLDRMEQMEILEQHFEPHKLSLEDYVEIQRKKHFNQPLT